MRNQGWFLVAVALIAGLPAVPAAAGGVTVVIHGWQPGMTGEPAWTGGMQSAVADARLDGESNFGRITVTGTAGALVATCDPWDVGLASSATGEVVVRVDWTAVANHQTNGITAQEVAAALAPKLYLGQSGHRPLAEQPIHLLGHSRGGGMVCEIARLLGLQGIEVDHLTPLDPHPLGCSPSDPPGPTGPVIDTPVAVYENVLFADSYWQDANYPAGVYVTGAYNRKWPTGLPGGYWDLGTGALSDHLNVHLAYHGTIDLATPASDGQATIEAAERTAWYEEYETVGGERGRRAGFVYARIDGTGNRLTTDTPVAGGDQVSAGSHPDPLIGGTGSRQALSWTAAQWPNVVDLRVSRGGTPLGAGTQTVRVGEALGLAYVYRDYDSSVTVTLVLDADRNPYNANSLLTIGTQAHAATGSSLASSTFAWDTGAVPAGTTGHVLARVEDGTRTRYLYAVPALRFRPADPGSDLDADGREDLVWRSNAGDDAAWLMDGATVLGSSLLPSLGTNWFLAGHGDLDGDHRADLLWRDPATGENAVWLMNGGTVASGAMLPSAGDPWDVRGLGDFDGDGTEDICWRNGASGENAIWFMAAGEVSSAALTSPLATSWNRLQVGDLDGDGRADLVWRDAASGENAVWLMNGGSVASGHLLPAVATAWTMEAASDLDGDGKADLVWRDAASGENAVWLMNGGSVASGALLPSVASPWAFRGAGDLDGDGRADIVWRNTASGENAVWLMDGATVRSAQPTPGVDPASGWDVAAP